MQHDAVAVEHLFWLAPGVGPALRHSDRLASLTGGTCQAIIPLIAIQLQDAIKAAQEGLCVLALAVGRVEEHDPRRIIAAPAPIIAGQSPEIPGFCLATPRVQDRRCGLVHEQLC